MLLRRDRLHKARAVHEYAMERRAEACRRSRAMACLVEDERLDAMAGQQSVVVSLESEFEHGCT